MENSRILNKFLKWFSRENYLAYKKIKNKCNTLIRNAKRKYFQDRKKDTTATSKTFWDAVNSFIIDKGVIVN